MPKIVRQQSHLFDLDNMYYMTFKLFLHDINKSYIREATREEKQLDFGFLLKGEGGGVQPESQAFKELFKEPEAGNKSSSNMSKDTGWGGVQPESISFEELFKEPEAGKNIARIANSCPESGRLSRC